METEGRNRLHNQTGEHSDLLLLEVAFENLKVSDKLTIEKSIDDVNPFSFEGTGLVVKGYVQVGFRRTIRRRWMYISMDSSMKQQPCPNISITGSVNCSSAMTVP